MTEFLHDLKIGVRQLARRPGFTVAALASLALGIGLTTTLFSVVNAVLLRQTPIAEPHRLAEVYTSASVDFPALTTSYPDFLAIQAEVPAFRALAAHAYVRGVLSTGGRPLLVTGEAVTANYFDALGLRPPLGRGFVADENRTPGAAPVVVVSHGLWQRQLGGRPEVVGATITVSGLPYTVVGVAPANFPGTLPGVPADFWVPVMMADRLSFSGVQWMRGTSTEASRVDQRGTRWLFVKGRLAEGASIEDARAQVATVFARLARDFPDTNENVVATVLDATSIRFHPMLDGYVKAASAGLLAAAGLVLLIACANVASLLLARATARRRELAIRAAIGAGRGRLIRQLLSESLVLATAGGALGTLLAWWAVSALQGVGTDVLPMRVDFDLSLDATVLAFSVAVSVVTALVFGLAPAWSASKPELVPALKDTLEGSGAGRRRFTMREGLVIGQLALSLVLLVAGALLGRGLLAARGTDLGFDPAPISALGFNLQMNGYDEDAAMAFRERALRTVQALPGVEAVSVTSRLPLSPDINMTGISIRGHHAPGVDPPPIDSVRVGADYFTVVGVPIVEGRAFTPQEVAEERDVAIVNETMARRYWPGRSAVGEVIYPGGFERPAVEIVGVARDHKVRSVGEDPREYVHFPAPRSRTVGLVVRTAAPASTALPMVRDALWALEPDIVFTEDGPAAEVAALTMAPTRIGAMVIGAFGALALVLAAMGLYGVIAYSVSLRTREVGIRMALGAERGQVLRLVLRQGGTLALAGIGIGVVASLGVGQVIGSLLYGVSGVDALAYGAAAGVLLLVALAANLGPALTASRVNPIRALRAD
ncbi:MAG: ABC transporter permease [Vicinamibacterales bacterium]|nr:ABC transporter permease [Vicinamibacterales bacterium]